MTSKEHQEQPETPQQETLSVEEQAQRIHQTLKEQAQALQGRAISALASLEILGQKLVKKGILTLSDAKQLKQDSQQLSDLFLDYEVGVMLSNDEFVEKMEVPQEARKLILKTCRLSMSEIEKLTKVEEVNE